MIEALLCYIINIYPKGVETCKLLDPLSQQIIQGGTSNLPDSIILEKLESYVQIEEKESDFNENWVSIEISAHAISTIFS
jgi:hypothetical protein